MNNQSPLRMYLTALGIIGILAILAMMTAADRVRATGSYECLNLGIARSVAISAHRSGDLKQWRLARASIKNWSKFCK